MSPLRLFRTVAVAEAITWALLLTGMFLKYVTETTESVVSVGGMLHGTVFVAYCLTTVAVGMDQRWSRGQLLLGLLSAVPPFVTIPFDRSAERRGLLGGSWRLVDQEPSGPLERVLAWLLRNPLRGAAAGIGAVAVLTAAALVAGPPVG